MLTYVRNYTSRVSKVPLGATVRTLASSSGTESSGFGFTLSNEQKQLQVSSFTMGTLSVLQPQSEKKKYVH